MTAVRELRPLTDEVVSKIFSVIADRAVLVGGQSLAFWVSRYEIPIFHGFAAISMDADYLGDRTTVEAIGSCFRSIVTFPASHAMTALVGNVQFIPDDESYMNVDVIHKIVGIKAKDVRDRSLDVETDGVLIRVMHPLHVLASRVANFYHLAEKQDQIGLMQTKLSIRVAHRYTQDVAANMEGGQKAALKIIEEIVSMAKSPAGKLAKLNGIDFFDAIPVMAIKSPNFHAYRLPRLVKELAAIRPQKNRTPIALLPLVLPATEVPRS